MNKYIVFLGVTLLFFGCSSDKETKVVEEVRTDGLFHKVDPSTSGLDFVNVLEETDSRNVLTYQYIYNGSGVSVGDINNDGLQDLFFTSNNSAGKLYLNKGNLQFEDITKSANIVTSAYCTGTVMGDINNDGYMDIYVCRSSPFYENDLGNLLFVNNGDNTFTEMSSDRGLAEPCYSTTANFFDIDNDGDLDLYVGNHPIKFGKDLVKYSSYELLDPKATDRLYINDGTGNFTDITKSAGVESFAYALSVSATDFNQDGYTDIYVTNDYYTPDFLYINQKNGTFKEQQQEYFKHTSTNAMGSDAADYNNDGLIDFMVLDMLPVNNYERKLLVGPFNFDFYLFRWMNGYGHQNMKNTLQLNRGNGRFSEIGCFSGVEATDWSWAPLMADFDNDGWKDIYVTTGYYREVTDRDFINYDANFLQKNNREMTFQELAKQLPVKKTQNYAFKNNTDLTFSDASTEWGLNEVSVSNGAAYADLDNDGDLDLIACNTNEPVFLYENTTNGNQFVQVKLVGESNKFGIGAKLTLKTNKGEQYLENYQTRGYNSSVAPVLNFGLGEAQPLQLTVQWPSGKTSVVDSLKKGQFITLKESEASSTGFENEDKNKVYFTEVSNQVVPGIEHKESGYVDYKREPLIPQMQSKKGPDLAIADINQDGLEDFVMSGSTTSDMQVMLQTAGGKFVKSNIDLAPLKGKEELALHFFDANGDKYPDLYVGCGSNEFGSLLSAEFQDHIYINKNGVLTNDAEALPNLKTNTTCVVSNDMDGDGDLDLFLGAGVVPGDYPIAAPSKVLKNDNGKFTDVTLDWIPALNSKTLINAAEFADIDGDDKKELIVAGEWMPVTVFKADVTVWKDVTADLGLSSDLGWWKSLSLTDLDGDGDLDIIAGNEGLNSQYEASVEKPIYVDYGDFDGNGRHDAILSQYYGDVLAPIYSYPDIEMQMKYLINSIYKYYRDYASTTTAQLLSNTLGSTRLSANTLSSVCFINDGGNFTKKELPSTAQFAPIFGFTSLDINGDGNLDVLGVGNSFDNKIEHGWTDALHGLALVNDGKGNFTEWPNTGFDVPGNAKRVKPITIKGKQHIIVTNNHDKLQIFRYEGA